MRDFRNDISLRQFLAIVCGLALVAVVMCAFAPHVWHETIITGAAVLAVFVIGGIAALARQR